MRPLRAPHRATPSQCRSSAARRRQPNAKEVVKRHRRTINCHQLHLSPDTLVATVVWSAQLATLAAMAAAGRRCYMAATTGDLDYTGGRGRMRPSDQWAAPSGGWLTKRDALSEPALSTSSPAITSAASTPGWPNVTGFCFRTSAPGCATATSVSASSMHRLRSDARQD